jgi:transcription elongation factor Elf1
MKAIIKDGVPMSPDGRRVFPFTCPKCGKVSYAAKSMTMTELKCNSGCGSCPCGAFLHLEMVPDLDGSEMGAVDWHAWIEKQAAEDQALADAAGLSEGGK